MTQSFSTPKLFWRLGLWTEQATKMNLQKGLYTNMIEIF